MRVCVHMCVCVRVHATYSKVNAKDSFGASALHLACRRGNHDAVSILLRCKNIDVCKQDNNNCTPLHEACNNGHVAIVDELIRHLKENYPDSVVDKVILQNKELQTPLHLACEEGHDEVVNNILVHFGNSSQRVKLMGKEDKNKRTPLHLACENEQKKVVCTLVENNDDVSAVGECGITCLHIAACYGYKEVAKSLLTGQNIDIDAVDEDNQTPLHYAASYARVEMVDFLISRYDVYCMDLYFLVECIVTCNLDFQESEVWVG